MPNFTAGTSFTDGVTNDVTAAKLNALVADAVPTSSLSLNSTTGTIATFNSTTGTITTGVIPTLTSTTLITTGTGTAATPAIQPTGDTNTGIFFPAADTIAFSEGGAEAMRIDSSGNLLVGTTAAGTLSASGRGLLEVNGSTDSAIALKRGGTQGLYLYTSSVEGRVGQTENLPLTFQTNATERLRIDSSGNCSIGTATALSKLHIHGDLTLSNATTAVTASTSTITPPATVAGYLTVSINGTSRKIAYYAT